MDNVFLRVRKADCQMGEVLGELPSRPLDWSPMIVVFGLNILERLVSQMLLGRL